ncbi:MAG: hypothetical protein WBX01_15295 [Nitrososphaeraceae archaeon]
MIGIKLVMIQKSKLIVANNQITIILLLLHTITNLETNTNYPNIAQQIISAIGVGDYHSNGIVGIK